MAFPSIFAGIFTPDADLIEFTSKALRIYCAVLGIFGIQIACQMTFVSTGNAPCSIIVAIVRKFVLLLPLIYLMPQLIENKTIGVYSAEPVADVIAVTFTAILFTIQFRKSLRKLSTDGIAIEVNEHTGEITSIKADGNEILRTPIHFNITRYTDNDRDLVPHWIGRCHLEACKPHIFECEKTDNGYKFKGCLAANCLMPAAEFELCYEVTGNVLTAKISYKLADYVERFPRFGIEFGVDKAYGNFSYVGFGPTESYVDKHIASEYGYYVSSAEENYDYEYIRPQESGSHYACKYLAVKNLFKVPAEQPFSCSVNPFTTEQLRETLHSFELEENDSVSPIFALLKHSGNMSRTNLKRF